MHLTDSRKGFPRRIAVVVAATAVAFALAATATAGSNPSFRVDYTDCQPWTNSSIMRANYQITAANLRTHDGEGQWVYVRTAL